MSIFEYLRARKGALFFTMALLAVSGVLALLNMPVGLFPDITFPRIVVLADNGEQPAERMMAEVTIPLETVANSVQGVRLVRSTTSRGSSEISIDLDWGADVQGTLQMLQGRIADVRNTLPQSATIQAEQMRVTVFPIQGYSLTSDTRSQVDLRDLALYQIRPVLTRIDGVAQVEITGGDTREYLVTIDPDKLVGYGLNPAQVVDAVRRSNIIASGGIVDDNYQLYLSLVSGKLTDIPKIESVVVTTSNGVPVYLSDVATVTTSTARRFIRTTAGGRQAVLVNIIKQPTGSTVGIGDDVRKALAAMKLPPDVHVENFYDQSDFINQSINSTRDSILIGIVLAMIVLLLFLRSWRITLVLALVVPTTIAATFICLMAVGKTINIMTLGGIAAAVGLIIDDSIVVIEAIFAAFSRKDAESGDAGGAFASTAKRALRTMMPAIVGSTASTLVIHIPLAFLGGITGAFFASLSITMVLALSLSFLISITFAPILASSIITSRDIEHELTRDQETRFAYLYRRAMTWMFRYRLLVIPLVLLLAVAAYYLYAQVGSGFLPDMDEGAFVLDYASPPGTSIEETDRMLMNVERMLMATPEVESYSRRTGTQMGFFITEPNRGDYLVKLRGDRSRSINEVIADVRGKIETAQPALQIDFGQLMQDVIGDLTNNPSPIEIKLFGDDQAVLQRKAIEVDSLIRGIPGVVDDFDGIVISGPSFLIDIDPRAAARAGFTVGDVADQLETVVRGTAPTNVQQGEKLVDIRLRYPDVYRNDIDRIRGLKLVNAQGGAVPLETIATFRKTGGEAEIDREGLRRLIAVTARIEGRDLGSTIADIKRKLASDLRLPPDVRLEFGGVYQTQQQSFTGLLYVAITAFGLVFVVLLFEFGEFAVPFSILVINLLSLLGVFGALWLTGVTFNITSFVGTIMIIGIVAENAIFIVHEFKRLEREGVPVESALIRASVHRARPILMTTLAAVLALLPLALGIGAGAQMQQPLAIAVIGGFSVSSLLLFFLLPVVYRLLGGRSLNEE